MGSPLCYTYQHASSMTATLLSDLYRRMAEAYQKASGKLQPVSTGAEPLRIICRGRPGKMRGAIDVLRQQTYQWHYRVHHFLALGHTSSTQYLCNDLGARGPGRSVMESRSLLPAG